MVFGETTVGKLERDQLTNQRKVICTVVHGILTLAYEMVLESKCGAKMDQFMLDIGLKDCTTDMVYGLEGQVSLKAVIMRVSILRITDKEMVCSYGLMEESTQATGNKTIFMDWVDMNGHPESHIKENGLKVSSTAKAYSQVQQVKFSKVNITKENDMVRVHLQVQVVK